MKRSLARRIFRAVNKSWNGKKRQFDRRGDVAALLMFEPDVFSEAPAWSPGEDFIPCTNFGSWYRDNGDTYTAVVIDVGPKDEQVVDGEWSGPEVWTVTAPKEDWVSFGSLWDKPRRISWMRKVKSADVQRERYQGHPAQQVSEYWEEFRERYGFVPQKVRDGHNPLGGERQWLLLEAKPDWADLTGEPDEVDLLNAVHTLVQMFPAKVRIFAYDRAKREVPNPIGSESAMLSSVIRCLNDLTSAR
ncbi:hypothetical protein ABZ502_16740 [Streptomyces abikoensis]|uniref:hypothetical protein n=1 Tax=Streptomyces abikoensis TaxID=97398 RepID=UPI0033DA6CD4